jgi:pyruvate dehydrogenase E1 component alpha subunit
MRLPCPAPTQFPEHEAIGVYGNKAEFQAAKANDPIQRFRSGLVKNGVLSEEKASRIEQAAASEMDDALQFALASPLPSPEEATNYVYA